MLRLAAAQWGVFHRDQALELGLSTDSIYRLVAAGEWSRIFTRTFSASPDISSWEQLAMAACLWAPGTAASHRCAAALWELDGVAPGAVEILRFAKKAAPGRGVIAHSTSTPFSIHRRHGIPVTSAARTLIDVASVLDADRVELAFESALRRRIISIDQLRRTLDHEGGRGRPGTELLSTILARHVPGSAATESYLESKVLRLLRRHGFPQPTTQHAVHDDRGAFIARIDFAYPESMVGIEADGYRWHSGREAWSRDRTRLTKLMSLGWRVLLVTAADVDAGAPEMVEALKRHLGQGTIPL